MGYFRRTGITEIPIREITVLRENEILRETAEQLNIPMRHLEGMRIGENPEKREWVRAVGKHLYQTEIQSNPGLWKLFCKIVPGGGIEEFADGYAEYVLHPDRLKQVSGEFYNYFMEKVFCRMEDKSK